MMNRTVLLATVLAGIATTVSAQTITWSGPRLTAEEAARVLSQCACVSNVAPALAAGTLPGVSGGGSAVPAIPPGPSWVQTPMALPLRLDGTPRYQPQFVVPFFSPGVSREGTRGGDHGRRAVK
jgi:hypothetical protein